MKHTKKEFELLYAVDWIIYQGTNLREELGSREHIKRFNEEKDKLWSWIEEAIKEARFEACNKCYKTGLKEGREEATGISFRKSVALDDDIADIEHG